MMRVFLTASVALVAVQQARAQDALTTTTLSPELGRGKVSSFIETESLSLSSLSSRIGPFYTSFVFAPGVNDYDYVSAIASGGPQDPSAETTTWKAYMAHQIETPSWTEKTPGATLWAYLNYTVGPTTYMDTLTYTEMTLTENSGTTTLHGAGLTTRCSYTMAAPKISIPDDVWATQDFETLQSDNWPTSSAVCTLEGHETERGSVTGFLTTQTLSHEGWRQVTVLGESSSAATATGTSSGEAAKQTESSAAQTGAGSGTGTEGAKVTSTQAAGAAEVTAWVNAFIVVAAAVVVAI